MHSLKTEELITGHNRNVHRREYRRIKGMWTHVLQIESAGPLTPAEIREALRRYWTSPIGPAASFTRNSSSHAHTHLLSC
jgi:hypothetical protein